eukprot:m.157130 g.157130  ORF g.157130 m.157130 type:complete len:968 (+) comp15109_c0_seq2:104-3007(+)
MTEDAQISESTEATGNPLSNSTGADEESESYEKETCPEPWKSPESPVREKVEPHLGEETPLSSHTPANPLTDDEKGTPMDIEGHKDDFAKRIQSYSDIFAADDEEDDEIDQSTEDPVVEEEQEPSSSKPKKFLPKRRVVTERQQRDQLMELQKRTAKLIREQDNLSLRPKIPELKRSQTPASFFARVMPIKQEAGNSIKQEISKYSRKVLEKRPKLGGGSRFAPKSRNGGIDSKALLGHSKTITLLDTKAKSPRKIGFVTIKPKSSSLQSKSIGPRARREAFKDVRNRINSQKSEAAAKLIQRKLEDEEEGYFEEATVTELEGEEENGELEEAEIENEEEAYDEDDEGEGEGEDTEEEGEEEMETTAEGVDSTDKDTENPDESNSRSATFEAIKVAVSKDPSIEEQEEEKLLESELEASNSGFPKPTSLTGGKETHVTSGADEEQRRSVTPFHGDNSRPGSPIFGTPNNKNQTPEIFGPGTPQAFTPFLKSVAKPQAERSFSRSISKSPFLDENGYMVPSSRHVKLIKDDSRGPPDLAASMKCESPEMDDASQLARLCSGEFNMEVENKSDEAKTEEVTKNDAEDLKDKEEDVDVDISKEEDDAKEQDEADEAENFFLEEAEVVEGEEDMVATEEEEEEAMFEEADVEEADVVDSGPIFDDDDADLDMLKARFLHKNDLEEAEFIAEQREKKKQKEREEKKQKRLEKKRRRKERREARKRAKLEENGDAEPVLEREPTDASVLDLFKNEESDQEVVESSGDEEEVKRQADLCRKKEFWYTKEREESQNQLNSFNEQSQHVLEMIRKGSKSESRRPSAASSNSDSVLAEESQSVSKWPKLQRAVSSVATFKQMINMSPSKKPAAIHRRNSYLTRSDKAKERLKSVTKSVSLLSANTRSSFVFREASTSVSGAHGLSREASQDSVFGRATSRTSSASSDGVGSESKNAFAQYSSTLFQAIHERKPNKKL